MNAGVKKSFDLFILPAKKLYGWIPYEKKLGRVFLDTYCFLTLAQEWTKEQKEIFQMEEIKRLIRHAYDNVPYYRRVFDERGIKTESIQDFDDLNKLPYLTKDIVRENMEELIALDYPRKKLQFKITGGTTGLPMEFCDIKGVSEQREWAFIVKLWESVGYNYQRPNRSVILRGNIPYKGYFEYRGLNLILSSLFLHEDKMKDYADKIEKFDPDYIQAYPSSIWILANFMLQNKIVLHLKNLKAIICSSEVLYDFQRKIINEAFQTKIYSFYGLSERSCLAGECKVSKNYHLISEYGFTELINQGGANVSKENEAGEIVSTGFNNYAMPFIRYRTGDVAINSESECSCGSNCKLLKGISGRIQDYFIDKAGKPVSFIFHDNVIWGIKDKISAYQYVQDNPGEVWLYIEDKGYLSLMDIRYLEHEFTKWFPTLEVKVRTMKQIERTRSGKFKFFVQNIPQNTEKTGIAVLPHSCIS